MNTGGDRPAEAASGAFARSPGAFARSPGAFARSPGAFARSSGAFAPVLEGCRPLFPPELVGDGGWERLLDRARRLPRSVSDTPFGFEFHLGKPSPDADLSVAAPSGSDQSRHFIREGARAERGASPAAKADAAARTAAAALAAGLREQAGNPDSYLARAVSHFVLEYDLVGLAPGRPPPPPGIFLAPRRDAPGSRDGFFEHRNPAGVLPALAAAVGWNGHEEMLGTVERIYAALPEGGHVFQAGAFPARSPKAFRIVVAGVGIEEVPALLERVEWPGPTDEAAEVLASMGGLVDHVAVSIDARAGGTGPRLGLELYRPRNWSIADHTGWRALIARLVECGWCLPEKAEGLRRWPGVEGLIGGGELHLVRQGINHVKVVVERGARTEAKAYAGMEVRPYG